MSKPIFKKGMIASETQFYVVDEVKKDVIVLKTDDGEPIEVSKSYAETMLTLSDYTVEEKTVTRTEATDIFVKSTGVALAINFNKQVKEADVVKEITEIYRTSTPVEAELKLKKAVKKSLEGEQRTLRGRHFGSFDPFGRVHVTDMEISHDASAKHDARLRLVDPRTINWLIVRGVKYVVK